LRNARGGAALIGYRTHDQKTIEGDLFQAFVAAGAISKANADDPKKSSFVRCARTDKGVHAAGNVISLKLIVEDSDIVEKINANLNPQIRVWGYERTNNSFSAYQLCDSRIYEYLIPTYSFLPPHPSSYLGRKVGEIARAEGDEDGLRQRQEEVQGFWERVDEEQIKPILDTYDEETRAILEKALYLREEDEASRRHEEQSLPTESNLPVSISAHVKTELKPRSGARADAGTEVDPSSKINTNIDKSKEIKFDVEEGPSTSDIRPGTDQESVEESKQPTQIWEGIKKLRSAYVAAKRAYRIPPSRLKRIREALSLYEGTRNYHNYTVQKSFSDPSAKRVIKSFVVNLDPILINGTEWLSLKVHGQSFMMHQIRKMVGMIALIVRCGCDPKRIVESYGPEKLSIPKAPSLGLLLERPIFDSYNKRAKHDLAKEPIDFDKYKKEMEEFKQREIYERMYRDEEKDNM
jgi:tRNA pseudouridine38-40 synthase